MIAAPGQSRGACLASRALNIIKILSYGARSFNGDFVGRVTPTHALARGPRGAPGGLVARALSRLLQSFTWRRSWGNGGRPGCGLVATPDGAQSQESPHMSEQSTPTSSASPEPTRPRRSRRWLFVTTVALVAAFSGAMATRAVGQYGPPGW